MPLDQNGQWYNPPDDAVPFDLAPTYITTSSSGPVFGAGGYDSAQCVLGSHEFYATAFTGSHNDIVWVAKTPGASSLTIEYVDPGTSSAALYTDISGSAVSVYLATSTLSAVTTTAAQIIAEVKDDSVAAIENAVLPILAPANNGSGVVYALAPTALAPPTGNSPTLDVSLQQTDDGTNFYESDSFAQQTAAGVDRQVFGPFADSCRWSYVVGGTGSVAFVISVGAKAKDD